MNIEIHGAPGIMRVLSEGELNRIARKVAAEWIRGGSRCAVIDCGAEVRQTGAHLYFHAPSGWLAIVADMRCTAGHDFGINRTLAEHGDPVPDAVMIGKSS